MIQPDKTFDLLKIVYCSIDTLYISDGYINSICTRMTPLHVLTDECIKDWSCNQLHSNDCDCHQLLSKHLIHAKTMFLDINILRQLDYAFDIQDIDRSDIYSIHRNFRKMFKHINKLIKEIDEDLYDNGHHRLRIKKYW